MSTYLWTVALHAALLSSAACIALLFLRDPGRRCLVAMGALLATAVIPWFSPLRPALPATRSPHGNDGLVRESSQALAEWTVVRFPAPMESAPRVPQPLSSRPPVSRLAAIWTTGSLLAGIAVIISLLRLHAWKRRLSPPTDEEWERLEPLLPGPASRTSFRVCRDGGGACVAGVVSPVMVLPDFLLSSEDVRPLTWTLRHEWTHWKSLDSRTTVMLEAVRTMHWWNPFVHLLIARWKSDREFVCDRFAGDANREDYGEFLLAMARRDVRDNALAIPMTRRGRFRQLRGRIRALLAAPRKPMTTAGPVERWSIATALAFGAMTVSGVKLDGEEPRDRAGDISAHPEPREKHRRFHVVIHQKVFFTAKDPVADRTVLSEEEMKEVIQHIARSKGSGLVNLPPLFLRAGDTATMEPKREKPEDAGKRPGVIGQGKSAGWTVFAATSSEGEKLKLTMDIGLGFEPFGPFSPQTMGSGQDPKEQPIRWPRVLERSGTSSAELASGETLVTSLGEVDPGWFANHFTTVHAIDAKGEVLASFEAAQQSIDEAAEPVPLPAQGQVRIEAMLANGKSLEDRDPDSLPCQVLTSVSDEQWEQLKQQHQAKKLATIRTITRRPISPWPEVAEFSLQPLLERVEPDAPVTLRLRLHLPKRAAEPEQSFTIPHHPGEVAVVELPVGEGKALLFLRASRVE